MSPSRVLALGCALTVASGACTNDYDRFSIGGGGAGSTSNATTSAGGASAGGGPATGGSGGLGGALAGTGGGTVCGDVDGACEPWWDTKWTLRRRIEIDTTGVTENLGNFPVLVRLDDTRIDYGSTMADGQDVRFVADDGATVLARDIEAWNPTGISAVWVQIPKVPVASGDPLVIWMYYGRASAPMPNNPKDAWSTTVFTSVHHLNGDYADATGQGHTGSATNAPTPANGRIAGAMRFDGSNDSIVLTKEADYDFTNAMTVSAWVRPGSFTKTWQAFVTKGNSSWRMHRDNGTDHLSFGTSHMSAPNDNLGGATLITLGAWHHVAMTYDGAQKTVYLDGALDGYTAMTAEILKNSYDVCIGDNLEATGKAFHGDIDEVRISPVALSASWVALERRTATDAAMLTFGAEQIPQP